VSLRELSWGAAERSFGLTTEALSPVGRVENRSAIFVIAKTPELTAAPLR
jgi:hypothetical protein